MPRGVFKRKPFSDTHIQNISKSKIGKHIGEKSPLWKGNNVTIKRIHIWLKLTFGKANRCDNIKCPNKSKIYDWSLIRGKLYIKDRRNFRMLCRQCHINYDYTDERRFKISKSHLGRSNSKQHNENIKKSWVKRKENICV